MKFDTIIIGGGLSGLVCGLELQAHGKNCAIITAGQNAMHFSSGTFNLLSFHEDGSDISDPIEAIASLGPEHPYTKIGKEKVGAYADGIQDKFQSWGIRLHGNPRKNGYLITHLGNIRPAWMAFEDTALMKEKNQKLAEKALVINFDGYLDFNTSFIANTLEKQGTQTRIASIRLEELERLRKSPTEMRSVNIARVMEDENVWRKLIQEIENILKEEDLVILPAVFGFKDTRVLQTIQKEIPARTIFIGTMPPSVPGIRTQMILKNQFAQAGGTIISGDTVREVKIEKGMIRSLKTENLDNFELEADHYVLATGTFFSKGLAATPHEIIEPLMHLDTDYLEGRENWYDRDFFKSHAYLSFGVKTDNQFHPSQNGQTIPNLYAIGSILSGFNPIDSGCGAGVAIFTALSVADQINNN